jgi:23S rRNA (uracil1939-C5)-methyltransferase
LGAALGDVDRSRTSVLLDPPAAGVVARVTDALVAMPVRQLVYVSCDPATLARDVGVLVRGGYVLERVTPVDMFPQTADIEVVAELSGRI